MRHFEAIADATDRPVIVYNIPGRVVLNLEPETIAGLAEIPNVGAVKQANADLEQARRILELGLDLYAGDDDLVLPFLELGGVGGVCVHTHVVGPQVKEMVRRFQRRRSSTARGSSRPRAPAGPRPPQGGRATRSRSRPRSTCSGTRSAATACRSSRRPRTSATTVRACLERLGLPVAA